MATEVECACGETVVVPDGQSSAECPKCGRTVDAESSDDWLSALDADEMALDGAAEPAAEAELRPAPAAPRRGGQAVRPTAAQPTAARPAAAQAPPPQGGPASAGARPVPTPRPVDTGPRGIWGLFRMLAKEELKDVRPFLAEGIRTPRFIVETAAALLLLSLFAGGAQKWLLSPREFSVGGAILSWLGLLVECAASCLLLALPVVLMHKPVKPVGISETTVVSRIGALALMAPIYVVMILIVANFDPASGSYAAIHWVITKLPTLYVLLLLAGNAGITCGIMKLGCAGGAVAAVVAAYASHTLSILIGGG